MLLVCTSAERHRACAVRLRRRRDLALHGLAELADLTRDLREDVVHGDDTLEVAALVHDGQPAHAEIAHRRAGFVRAAAAER